MAVIVADVRIRMLCRPSSRLLIHRVRPRCDRLCADGFNRKIVRNLCRRHAFHIGLQRHFLRLAVHQNRDMGAACRCRCDAFCGCLRRRLVRFRWVKYRQQIQHQHQSDTGQQQSAHGISSFPLYHSV